MAQRDEDLLKGGIKGDTARASRLAAELRANLRRRKMQAKCRADGPAADEQPPTGDAARDKT